MTHKKVFVVKCVCKCAKRPSNVSLFSFYQQTASQQQCTCAHASTGVPVKGNNGHAYYH